MTIRYVDLFAGIGGFRIAAEKAFKELNVKGECVFSCEIDSHCQKTYAKNFGETPFGDVKELDENEVPDFNLLFAGFPCQSFSIIGKKRGFGDARGALFFDIARILKAKKPDGFVLENVRQLSTHDKGNTLKKILEILKDLGYTVYYEILNSLDYGLPQKRERTYFVGLNKQFEFNAPPKKSKYKPLSEILENKVEPKYYASEKIKKKRKEKHKSRYKPAIWHENKSGHISSYPYSCALRANASYNYLLVDGERRLTPREALRLQGFPDWFEIVSPTTQVSKQTGNAVPVHVAHAILKQFLPVFIEKGIK